MNRILPRHRHPQSAEVRRLLLFCGLIAVQAATTAPQQYRAEVAAVRIQVVPVDGDGQVVGGLPQRAFRIRVNDAERPILDVQEIPTDKEMTGTSLARDFVVLFDLWTGSPRQAEFREAYSQVHRLIDRMGEGDRMSVLLAPVNAIKAYAPLTSDRDALHEAVQKVAEYWKTFSPAVAYTRCCNAGIFEAFSRYWSPNASPGRVTNLLFFSQGDKEPPQDVRGVSGYVNKLRDAVLAVQDLGVVVHAFLPSNVPGLEGGVSGRDWLEATRKERVPGAFRPINQARTFFYYAATKTSGTAWFYAVNMERGVDEVMERSAHYYVLTVALEPDDGRELDVRVQVDAPGPVMGGTSQGFRGRGGPSVRIALALPSLSRV